MCQMRLIEEKEGKEQLLFEDVTRLQVDGTQLAITTLFEGTTTINASIDRIDFSAGKIFLNKNK